MSFNIKTIPFFDKQLKSLAKKYPSIKTDISVLGKSLQINPSQGSPLGKSLYKIRLTISSKGKGKSGGGRIITYVYFKDKIVYLVSIYYKSEKETVTEKELLFYLSIIHS